MNKQIGAQYWTIRDFCGTVENFDAACKRIADIGYKIVQISGTPLKASEMRPILDKYGLKCVTTHRGFDDFLNNLDEIIDYNKTLGCIVCGIGDMPKQCEESDEGVTDFIKKANEICAKLKAEGMLFGYHNHAKEFARHNGKLIMDRIIEETDSEAFTFIVDTLWLQVGGVNPADFIKRLGKRARIVHFKDHEIQLDNWRSPQWCTVGKGNLDWDSIIDACEEAGSLWALVEIDGNWLDNDPFKSLEFSYNFLKTKGFC